MSREKIKARYWEQVAIRHCEKYGIYEIYKQHHNRLIYYSFFGSEGFYRIEKDLMSGEEKRTHLRYKKTPAFLLTKEGYTRYNYFTG